MKNISEKPPSGEHCQREFFDLAPGGREVQELFEYLPGICFYAKNRWSQFVKVNAAMLANHGASEESEMLGKTDREFHPPALAEAYIAEDQRVMAGRRVIPNQIWLVPHCQGTPHWYVSSKTPLFASDDPTSDDPTSDDQVVGIAGVMYRIETPEDQKSHFQEVLPAMRHMEQHFTEKIRMAEMTARVGLSATHFNRRFRELLHISPSEYVLLLRVRLAQRLLTEGSKRMAHIADQCGFFDQSHFTKRFSKVTGISPLAYRSRFRRE